MAQTQQKTESKLTVSLTENEVVYTKAVGAVEAGKVMATAAEAATSAKFVKDSEKTLRESWVWVSYEGAPSQNGYHKIDFANRKLVPISDSEADRLKWNEKLYVSSSVLDAVKDKRPLALGVDGDRFGLGLGGYGGDYAFRVAQRDAGKQVAATQPQKAMLRVEGGQTVVFTSPSGVKMEMKVQKGTTVHVE